LQPLGIELLGSSGVRALGRLLRVDWRADWRCIARAALALRAGAALHTRR
jgi:hypothetical protein